MATTEFIPTFRKSHDPADNDEVRNVGIGGALRRISGTYLSVEVTVPEGPDSSLLISDVAFSPSKLRISFRLTGGIAGRYKIRLRITLTDGRPLNRSFWQIVRDN